MLKRRECREELGNSMVDYAAWKGEQKRRRERTGPSEIGEENRNSEGVQTWRRAEFMPVASLVALHRHCHRDFAFVCDLQKKKTAKECQKRCDAKQKK
jgi:hypothetical protein